MTTYNVVCNPTETRGGDDDDVDNDDEEEYDCDAERDLWQKPNMLERIIRFKPVNSTTANVIADKKRCNWKSNTCQFRFIALIPKYDGNITDPNGLFYGEAVDKILTIKRKQIKKAEWIYTNELSYGEWLYREGRMGDYFIYKIIQLNEKSGTEITLNVNDKFTSGAKFTFGIEKPGGIKFGGEANRSVENSVGRTIKWTEKDWELGEDIVNYCHCQSCNNWQGFQYSTGQFNFSIRECSQLYLNCQP